MFGSKLFLEVASTNEMGFSRFIIVVLVCIAFEDDLPVLRQAQVAIPKDIQEHQVQGLNVGGDDGKGQKVEGDPKLRRRLDSGDEFGLEFPPRLFH